MGQAIERMRSTTDRPSGDARRIRHPNYNIGLFRERSERDGRCAVEPGTINASSEMDKASHTAEEERKNGRAGARREGRREGQRPRAMREVEKKTMLRAASDDARKIEPLNEDVPESL